MTMAILTTTTATTVATTLTLILSLLTISNFINATNSTTTTTDNHHVLRPSKPLTSNERAILSRISRLPQHDKNENDNYKDPHGLLQPLHDRIQIMETEFASLTTFTDDITATALKSSRVLELSDRIRSLRSQTENFVRGDDGTGAGGVSGIKGYNVGGMEEVERRLDKLRELVEDEHGKLDLAIKALAELDDEEDTGYDVNNVYDSDEDREVKDGNEDRKNVYDDDDDDSPVVYDDDDDDDDDDSHVVYDDDDDDDRYNDDDDDDEDGPTVAETTTSSTNKKSDDTTNTNTKLTYEEMQESIRYLDLVQPLNQQAASTLRSQLSTTLTSTLQKDEARYQAKAKELEGKIQNQLDNVKKVEPCVDLMDAGGLVMERMVAEEKMEKEEGDGGMVAGVVYGEGWTSETFDPSSMSGASRKSRRSKTSKPLTVREVLPWLIEYIPEDWERLLLPKGWEDYDFGYLYYNVADYGYWMKWIRSSIPMYVWHSLPSFIGGLSSKTAGVAGTVGSIVPPPETVLGDNTNLGSCWPMGGSRDGRITLRLKYPVRLDDITIEHFSGTFSSVDKESAPRSFDVLGFPPCDYDDAEEEEEEDEDSGKKKCRVVGFDAANSVRLGSFMYRIVPKPDRMDKEEEEEEEGEENVIWPTRSIQTFKIGSSSLSSTSTSRYSMPPRDDDEEEEDNNEHDSSVGFGSSDNAPMPGSCSISSCAPPPPEDDENDDGDFGLVDNNHNHNPVVEAVQIQILDNWGNPDFTCLYRIRLHGRPV